jgi:hypothetical protein
MSRFQQRLWEELVREHAALLVCPQGMRDPLATLPIVERSPRGSGTLRSLRPLGAFARPGRLAAVLTTLAAAIALSAILTTTGTAPSAAYAVTRNPDGTITVSIAELTGVAGANVQLSKLGVRVKVVPVQSDCTATGQTVPIPGELAARIAHPEGQGLAISPNLVPPGETLVLTARQTGAVVGLGYSLYRGAVPACIEPGEAHAG